jgi:hypothetical protein
MGWNTIEAKLPEATTKLGRRAMIFVGSAEHKQKHRQHDKNERTPSLALPLHASNDNRLDAGPKRFDNR